MLIISMSWDLIIVGAGIAGLRTGIESLKKNPKLVCCIVEKYNYIGGRVVTFHKKIPIAGEVQWENGAGRISNKHKKVLSLLQQYGLNYISSDEHTDYINEYNTSNLVSNKFTKLKNIYLEPLKELPPDILAKYTIGELLEKTVGYSRAKNFYIQFPYYSEIHTLRADIALKSFDAEMSSNKGFGVCKEGLSSLIDAMRNEFLSRGGIIFLECELEKIDLDTDDTMFLFLKGTNSNKRQIFSTKTCVLALHQAALKNIEGINYLTVLNHLKMMPLLRMYAVFPTKKGVSWFSGLNKIVTNSFIRYIIPINAGLGIVMISYTDGEDAEYWFKQNKAGGNENVQELVMTEVRRLFPERVIPDPIFFKQHAWYDGCTYWLPGTYNVEEESQKSLHPIPQYMPNLFMCGESFAVKQCWMESALDQADKMLALPSFNNSIHIQK
jgi:Flavin containing amine oxidoreductase